MRPVILQGALCLPGCLLLALGPCSALASPPPLLSAVLAAAPRVPEVERAQRQLEEGDFEEAVRTLQSGLAQPDLTDEQLAELYRVLGLAQLYLGREAEARSAFERLLQARPDYELPASEAPKIRALYARLKEDIKKRRVRPVTLTLEPLAEAAGGQPLVLSARVEDLALGSRPRLYYRRVGRQAFSSVDFRKDSQDPARYQATVPAFELPAEDARYEVEYYAEVADAAQRRLAGRGDAYSPLLLSVLPRGGASGAASAGPAWYQSPWLYVVGGAVVAGAAVGVYAATSQPQTTPISLTVTVTP